MFQDFYELIDTIESNNFNVYNIADISTSAAVYIPRQHMQDNFITCMSNAHIQ